MKPPLIWKEKSICENDTIKRADVHFNVKYLLSFISPIVWKTDYCCIILVPESCILIMGIGKYSLDKIFDSIWNGSTISTRQISLHFLCMFQIQFEPMTLCRSISRSDHLTVCPDKKRMVNVNPTVLLSTEYATYLQLSICRYWDCLMIYH